MSTIRAGGLGEARQPDDRVKEVVGKIKPHLEEATGLKFDSIDVVHYKSQVVAGTNYFVQVSAIRAPLLNITSAPCYRRQF